MHVMVNCIAAGSRFPLECAEFLAFVGSAEGQSLFASDGIWVGRKDMSGVYRRKHPDAPWHALEEATQAGKALRSRLHYISDILNRIVNVEMFKFTHGQITAAEALKRIALQFECYRASVEKESGG